MVFVFPGDILSCAVDLSSLQRVFQAIFDDSFQFGLNFLIINGGKYFDPVVQIPGHPVGRTCQADHITCIFENENSRMFQITVDNSVDPDVFAYSRDSCDDRTITSYHQVDLYACGRSFIKLSDQCPVCNMVYLS